MARTFPKSGYDPVTGDWNDSLKGDYFWSNVNVSEAVPDVMTPSTWSLWWIYHYEVSPFEFPGDHPMCGNICGRPYLNLGLLGSIYRALGRDVRREIQGDMVSSIPTEALADPASKLHLDLTAQVGEIDANTLLSNLSGSAVGMESLGPLVGMSKVQKGEMSREQYLEQYGHRSPHEMELFTPGPSDDPTWFEKQLLDFTQSTTDVDTLLATQRAECIAAWQRLEARFPNKLKTIRRQKDIIAIAAKNREAVRSEVTRIARLVRQFLLQVGKVTGTGDSIFFITLDEMMAVLAGDKSFVGLIPARRAMYPRYSALPPYPAIIYGRFDPFQWAADPNRRSDFYDARQTRAAAPSSTIKGFAGAAGCVEGTVRRIDCMEDGDQVQPGEILVTTITNVGWTPLFPRLAAIVTDVGAPLSHAAIVARELGIPAVVGCGNATMLLRTGDRVRVDGGRGVGETLTS